MVGVDEHTVAIARAAVPQDDAAHPEVGICVTLESCHERIAREHCVVPRPTRETHIYLKKSVKRVHKGHSKNRMPTFVVSVIRCDAFVPGPKGDVGTITRQARHIDPAPGSKLTFNCHQGILIPWSARHINRLHAHRDAVRELLQIFSQCALTYARRVGDRLERPTMCERIHASCHLVAERRKVFGLHCASHHASPTVVMLNVASVQCIQLRALQQLDQRVELVVRGSKVLLDRTLIIGEVTMHSGTPPLAQRSLLRPARRVFFCCCACQHQRHESGVLQACLSLLLQTGQRGCNSRHALATDRLVRCVRHAAALPASRGCDHRRVGRVGRQSNGKSIKIVARGEF